jgi:hypothetical protein
MYPALPQSELVTANTLPAAIPGFFSSSQFNSKLKEILDQYKRSDIHLDAGSRLHNGGENLALSSTHLVGLNCYRCPGWYNV